MEINETLRADPADQGARQKKKEDDQAINRAWTLGFPLMVKSADGGGGIGLFNTQWSETPVLDGLAPAAEATWNVESKCSCSTLH